MSGSAAAILEQIHGLPRVEREAVYYALAEEMRRKPREKSAARPIPPADEWARSRLAELESIYGKAPRASSSDVLDDLRADRI